MSACQRSMCCRPKCLKPLFEGSAIDACPWRLAVNWKKFMAPVRLIEREPASSTARRTGCVRLFSRGWSRLAACASSSEAIRPASARLETP